MTVDLMKVKPGVEVAGLTDVGCQRQNNEDSFLYWEPVRDIEFKQKGRLAVIADGMGGHDGGLEASRLAVETVRKVYGQSQSSDPQGALVEALIVAHARIREFAERYPAFYGMGTTCTALVVRERMLYFAHIGDSRLYLVRQRAISRLTRDHSYVGRLVESGLVSLEDAGKHPQRHILTAALGAGIEAQVDHGEPNFALQEGDNLLLCTDGLWGVLNEEELSDVVSQFSPVEACLALVERARQRGGPDNITLQILRIAR
jgi:PPM family protein phosphatase